jgi:hypothetical protein
MPAVIQVGDFFTLFLWASASCSNKSCAGDGKKWAAAFALGLQDIDEGFHVNTLFAETIDSHDSFTNEKPAP